MTQSNFHDNASRMYDALRQTQAVPQLSLESSRRFDTITIDEWVEAFIKEFDIIIAAGGYFGDEGKGKIIARLAKLKEITAVLRLNSGENAGHTFYANGVKYVAHLTPSGILVPEKVCGINGECVMDPVNYVEQEIEQFKKSGVDYKERLFVGNVHIVGPHHRILDFALSPPNSSTLMGMAYVHASKVKKRGLRLDNLFNARDEQVRILKKDLEDYWALLKQNNKEESKLVEGLEELKASTGRHIPTHLFDFLKAGDKIEYTLNLYKERVVDNPDFPQRRDIGQLAREILEKGGKLLGEAAQGFWLSNGEEAHWGTSTSAQVQAAGTLASLAVNATAYRTGIVNIFKTPGDSRVGIGANPAGFVPQDYFSSKGYNKMNDLKGKCVDFGAIQKKYFESIGRNGILEPTIWTDESGRYSIGEAMAISSAREFDESGATTGKPRVTGLFDAVAAAYVNKIQGPYLFISALDRGDKQNKVGIVVAYVYHHLYNATIDSNGKNYNNGDIIKIGDGYPTEEVLKHCYPIIKVMDGWKETPINVDKRNSDGPLPENLQRFLGAIEELTGFKIIGFGNGKGEKEEKDAIVYLPRVK